MTTIFVSVANYRDPEVVPTVKSIFANAAHPENVTVGVVNQKTRNDLFCFPVEWEEQIREINIHARDAKGAGYARALAQSLYQGEDFFLQIDSHTQMLENWDVDLLEQYDLAKNLANTEKVILSQFPAGYIIEGNDRILLEGHKDYTHLPTRQVLKFFRNGVWSAERKPMTSGLPEESETVLAGLIFAPGSIVSEVPYDPEISFFGEELCFAVRAWTRGWKIYSPAKMTLLHFYTRPSYHKIWDTRNNNDNKWEGLERKSRGRQKRIYLGEDMGIWGVASKESMKEYEQWVNQPVGENYAAYVDNYDAVANQMLVVDLDALWAEGREIKKSLVCTEDLHTVCTVNGCQCNCHS